MTNLLVSAVYSKTRIDTVIWIKKNKEKKKTKVFASFKTLITPRENFTYVYTNCTSRIYTRNSVSLFNDSKLILSEFQKEYTNIRMNSAQWYKIIYW